MSRSYPPIISISGALLLLVVTMNGCGQIQPMELVDLTESSITYAEDSPYQCESRSVSLADIAPLNAKRLSVRQYRNTLTDLLSTAVGQSGAAQLTSTVLAQNSFPGDTGDSFSRENNTFARAHAISYFAIAEQVASRMAQNSLDGFVRNFIALDPGSCTSISVSNLSIQCRTQLVKNFAGRAYRRPLRVGADGLSTSSGAAIDEAATLLQEMNSVSTQEGVNRLVFRVLLSPHFLFHIEDQNLAQPHMPSDGVYKLSSFAIANRLAYRFWNTMPDSTLWSLAASEDLAEDSSFAKALSHVLNNKTKLSDALKEYYHDWLHLEKTPRFNVNSRFPVIAGNNITFDDELTRAMIAEVEELGAYTTASGGSFVDLFTTNISFARDQDLLRIYGLSDPAPASITEQNAVRFPSSERGGLLTRAAMLVSGSELTNPILRGAHLRKNILCLPLGSAPAGALDEFANIDVPYDISTREKVHIKTSGRSCMGCHNLINPLGFGFSHYNAFGMYSPREPIFREDNNNVIESYVNVSSEVDLSSTLGPGSHARDATELSALVATHPSTKSCFVEKSASFILARGVDAQKDACRLNEMYNHMGEKGRLLDMMRAAALDPEFRFRKIE